MPAGRPQATTEQVEQQRARLILAAARTFQRMGYANAAVADVIAEAGMSRRSFYEHFSSKEDALIAVVEYGAKLLVAETTRRVQGVQDPVRRLEIFLDSALEIASSQDAPMIGYQVMAAGEVPRERRRQMLERVCDVIEAQVALAHRQGAFSRPPDRTIIRLFIGGLDALLLSYHAEGRARDIRQVSPIVKELLFRAFR